MCLRLCERLLGKAHYRTAVEHTGQCIPIGALLQLPPMFDQLLVAVDDLLIDAAALDDDRHLPGDAAERVLMLAVCRCSSAGW